MSALERAERDAAAGDLGSARRRLCSYIATVGYEPQVCERIARLSMQMGDPVEAGRWYLLCESSDADAGAAIDRFKGSCGGDPRQMYAQLPMKVRSAAAEVMSGRVRELADRFGPPRLEHRRKTPSSKIADALFMWGCAATLLVALASMCIGIWVMARWLIRVLT